MAGVGAWLAANAATISAAGAVAGAAVTASSAHHARVDARNVTRTAILGRQEAERKRRQALKVQEGLLVERARERRTGGFGATVVAGRSRNLGVSDTGGKSLLG
jgi:hypothetical protein